MLIIILLPISFLLPSVVGIPWGHLYEPGSRPSQIIDGWKAWPYSRPYMAYLKIQNGKEETSCGGFLVSRDFVLTAAHCNGEDNTRIWPDAYFKNSGGLTVPGEFCKAHGELGTDPFLNLASRITVKLGAHNINKWEWSQQVIPVRRRIPHPKYNEEIKTNDIMLLQLAKRAKLNRWVKTIPLPRANELVKPGTNCSVSGWGRTRYEWSPAILREVYVEVLEDSACPRTPNGPYQNYNPSTMMCVGDPKKRKDSAEGDSGGPLVCRNIAQGIVSWGPSTPPGVYTRVSTFIRWIQKKMRKLKS